MSIQLDMNFDGPSSALNEHRLSIAELGEPLTLLLKAFRRTASNLVTQAVDEGKESGRLATAAKQMDIQLVRLAPGSLTLEATVVQDVPRGAAMMLPGMDLAEQTSLRVFDDIEAESRGQFRNAAVRKYLLSMPPGTRQKYTARRGAEVLREVTVDAGFALASAPPSLPRMLRVRGSVVAVGLEPNAETVTVRGEDKKVFAATQALVDRALALRHAEVVASGVEVEGKLRLLRIDAADEAFGTFEERADFVMERWAKTLETLSK